MGNRTRKRDKGKESTSALFGGPHSVGKILTKLNRQPNGKATGVYHKTLKQKEGGIKIYGGLIKRPP